MKPSPRFPTKPRARAFAPALFALSLALAPAARAQQPARADTARAEAAADARGSGTITVRVLGEDNQPVANAVVSAVRLGSSSNVTNDNSGATTGRYVLSNLDPGVYRVSVYAPGFVPEIDPNAAPGERNLFRPGDAASFRLVKGGVLTGRVTDAEGEPAVGATISVVRVRDAAGRPPSPDDFGYFGSPQRRADDRGVFRIYGLQSGSYIVRAGGRSSMSFGSRPSAYDGDAATYYPSATRDGAVEVQVQAGQEAADIDIRLRGERGHTVSGTVAGAFGTGDFGAAGAGVSLRRLNTTETEGFAYVVGAGDTRSFDMEGIADGEYEIVATSGGDSDKGSGTASAVQRVTVRGADVTGLRLSLAPLATVAGRVAVEPLAAADAARPECKDARPPALYEMLVGATRDAAAGESPFGSSGTPERVPDERGEFTLRNLTPGRYRLGLRLTDDSLYARSITQAAGAGVPAGGQAAPANAARAAAAADIARNGISVGAGERLAGVVAVVAQGAAGLRGRLASADDDTERPSGTWRVHLVPAEAERADDVLRYAETLALPDGSFAFRNLAPGRYHFVARPVAEAELRPPARQRRAAWEAASRAELRREAEAAKNAVTLTPCQRAEDFTLRVNAK
ncbi:MAG TPA: carboxypeptidase-like regulatory domain-containing protein [Pyrinomonadaceae bacterium]|nr:carboxypeptidase-like regulatory domain-containing protein [Pyrinomonadaceae bacterium]